MGLFNRFRTPEQSSVGTQFDQEKGAPNDKLLALIEELDADDLKAGIINTIKRDSLTISQREFMVVAAEWALLEKDE